MLLEGVEPQHVHDAVSTLLGCGAIEGTSGSKEVVVQMEPWVALLRAGYMKRCDVDAEPAVGGRVADAIVPGALAAAVQLSLSALRGVIPGAVCHASENLFSPCWRCLWQI